MKSLGAAALCLLALAGPALAADYADPLPRYERAGDAFACHMTPADVQKTNARHWDSDQACMWIGPLSVGMSRTSVEKLLGAPDQNVIANGRQNYVYVVHRDEAQKATAYSVVTYDAAGATDTIQLTGQGWPEGWRFAGLMLGDSDAAVRTRLGAPLHTKPSDEAGTIVWEYPPSTFSIEIHDNKISSIRAEKASMSRPKSQKA